MQLIAETAVDGAEEVDDAADTVDEPVIQAADSVDRWQQAASTLLAGGGDHAAPVGHALFGAFRLQLHDAARSEQRRYRRNAEFDGFLDRVVHALTA